MNGKSYPQIGRIEVSVIQEEQPTWLAFKSAELDLVGIPQPLIRQLLRMDPGNPWRAELKPDLQRQGIRLLRSLDEEITFYAFGMKDPVVGGYGKDKIALRRAITMAFNTDETIRDIRRNQAVKVQYVVPPNVAGHNPDFRGAFPTTRRWPTPCWTASAIKGRGRLPPPAKRRADGGGLPDRSHRH